jgi:hypothetical protein
LPDKYTRFPEVRTRQSCFFEVGDVVRVAIGNPNGEVETKLGGVCPETKELKTTKRYYAGR